MSKSSVLVVWDFDWSLVNENSDTYIVEKFDQELRDFMTSSQRDEKFPVWTDLMAECFRVLHQKHNARKQQLHESLKDIPVFPQNLELVRSLKDHGAEQIIISDANTFLIESILAHLEVRDHFHEIYTNPASFDDNGQLQVSWFHPKDSPPHGCERCSKNICKGSILSQLLEQKTKAEQYPDKILYVGDGGGDYCPTLRLRSVDAVFARSSWSLHKKINKNRSAIQCSVFPWEDGAELQAAVLRFLEKGDCEQ